MTAHNASSNPILSIRTTASEEAVRDMTEALRSALEDLGTEADLCGSITIVVAEALNNVVEHAYAGQPPGPIKLTATQSPEEIQISLRDTGCSLPNGTLPVTRLPDVSGPLQTLPEGGFGWYLIRDLTSRLTYRRESGENRLDMVFAHNQKFDLS